MIGRREFITLLGGAAAWPVVARGQSAMPIVGFLRWTSRATFEHLVTGFQHGLKEAGVVEGQNVSVEYRYADNQPDRLHALLAELISRPVAVIVTQSSVALLAKAGTPRIPIVFVGGGDPIKEGLVVSFNRPDGNVTGVSFLVGQLGSKRLELLRQLVLKSAPIAMLVQPNTPETEAERKEVQAAAQAIGQQLIITDVRGEHDIESAFAAFVQSGAGAVLVGAGGLTTSNRERIVALATRHALPAIYPLREFATAGGLMSYGTNMADAYRQAGSYAGRILKGEKPADLPIMQSTKFEFVLNIRTAKALGLDVPDKLLALADEVIE